MPCVYYLPGEEEAIKLSELRKELDKTTDLLCRACRALENIESNNMLAPGTAHRIWWDNHKKKDQERFDAEKRQKEHDLKNKKNELEKLKAKIKKLEKDLK